MLSLRTAIRAALCEVFNRRGIGQLTMCSETEAASATLPSRETRPTPPPPPHSSHPSQEVGWRPTLPVYEYPSVLPPPAPYYFGQPAAAEGSARLPRYLSPRPYVPYMWGYYDHRLQPPPPALPPPPSASRLRHYYVPTSSAAPATAQTASRRMDRDAKETHFANRLVQ